MIVVTIHMLSRAVHLCDMPSAWAGSVARTDETQQGSQLGVCELDGKSITSVMSMLARGAVLILAYVYQMKSACMPGLLYLMLHKHTPSDNVLHAASNESIPGMLSGCGNSGVGR